MKHTFRTTLLLTVLTAASCALAAEPETLAKLDEALKAVPAFQHGDSGGPLMEIERIVFQLPTDDPSREAIEEKVLETLQAATTADAKQFLCTQLRVIGTDRCVPALEGLLADPEVADAAVYALGRLETRGIPALSRALEKTSGRVQAAIVNALADLEVCQAFGKIRPLLGASDPIVATAAARALGRLDLGRGVAIAPLTAARPDAAGPLALEIDNALLLCAEQMAVRGEKAKAAAVYEGFYKPDRPIQLRCAGLRGLVLTQEDKAVGLLREAIQSEDPELQRTAIAYIPLAEGPQATLGFAGALDALQPEGKVLLLQALGDRGDAAAGGVIWAEAKDPEQAVRIAALEALGKLRDVSVVRALAEAAAKTEGTEQKVARASLLRLDADDANRKLIELVEGNESSVRIEALGALAGRDAAEAVGAVLEAASDDDSSVRRAAISALGTLVEASDLPAVIRLAVEPKQAEDRPVAEEALGRVLTRVEDADDRSRPLLAALKAAPLEARPTLVRLLSKAGSSQALAAVRAALGSPDAAVAQAAVAALARWPDTTVTDDLLKLIASAQNDEQKSLALEGFVRLAATADNPTAMYVRVLDLVERVNDRKLVLARLGESDSSDSVEVLQLAKRFLHDEQLGPSAGLATLRIANRLKDRDAERARAALKDVIETVRHDDVRQRAQEVINDMEKYDDHILKWVGAGPFTEKGKASGEAAYATVFAPEQSGVQGIQWQPITKGIGSWEINLESTFGGVDHCAAYLRTRVLSPAEQEAQLEMGSDDAVKAWLNGAAVYDQYGGGGVAPRQKRVKVKLQKGWNELMLKVVDHEGGWVFCCRLRRPDGTALEGLKIEAQ
ncbi:MAG: HEAT repeat domain-containing protein [Pirellulales bacterium]|nr:HEAT repeat domain-containing protein [Pirellulales bacterium]